MSTSERVNIPLVSELIPQGIKPNTILIVEYDPDSQWFALATTIAARFLLANGRVGYVAFTRSPDDVRRDLSSLGVDVSSVQKEGRLTVDDWYSASLTGGRLESSGGQTSFNEPIEGGMRMRSLKVADLSVQWLRDAKYGPQPFDIVETWPPGSLSVGESFSALLRFNEERELMEWTETRVIPIERKRKGVSLWGLVNGIHSEVYYKRLESALDGVIDVRVTEREGETKDLLRIRSLKGQPHDHSWHEIQIKENGEAALKS